MVSDCKASLLPILYVFRVEAEFDAKLKSLEEKHAKEIAEVEGPAPSSVDATTDATGSPATDEPNATKQDEEKERKQSKARRKREKAKEKERERELEIERENAEAGPSLRQIEVEQIQNQIAPLGLQIAEVASDGNCLYRAVAAHSGGTYQETRKFFHTYDVPDWSAVAYAPFRILVVALSRQSLRRHSIEK